MRIVNFILAIMFVVFAFLQVNDPDPVLWILIYGAMAAICIMAMYDVYYRMVLAIFAAGQVIYCVLLFPSVRTWWKQEDLSVLFDEGMKMQHLYIEESREFLGLCICIIVLVAYSMRATRGK